MLKGTTFTKYRQFVENCFAACPRQALHARTLASSSTHPGTPAVESPLPDDMNKVLERWRNYVSANPPEAPSRSWRAGPSRSRSAEGDPEGCGPGVRVASAPASTFPGRHHHRAHRVPAPGTAPHAAITFIGFPEECVRPFQDAVNAPPGLPGRAFGHGSGSPHQPGPATGNGSRPVAPRGRWSGARPWRGAASGRSAGLRRPPGTQHRDRRDSHRVPPVRSSA